MGKGCLSILIWLISSLAYAADQPIFPSTALLKMVGVDRFTISKNVRLMVTRDDIKTPQGIRVYDNASYLPLFFASDLTGVKSIKVAVESASHIAPSRLFTITNEGGVSSPKLTGTLPINLAEYERYGVINIWIFYFTSDGIFASYIQTQAIGY